ncbi:MAG: hypothetical protein MSR67_06135 [Oscillospiraceae bacterium]|nr:hypothetical protein [Oscillospiraceae bacterium]
MKKTSWIKSRSRKATLRVILRWALYSAALLVMFVFLRNPVIRGWCPLAIIPLAVAVAMFEGDLAAGIFGAVCGLMLDIASGTTAGFYAIWLLCACPVISLLSRFWIKVNIASHFVLNAAVSVIVAVLDVVFLHWVWEGSQFGISFVSAILPAYGGSILLAAPVYLLVAFIVKKLRPDEKRKLEDSARSAEDSESKESE